MRIDIVTLFPELCDGFLSTSILGRARAKNLFEAHCHQIRDYTKNKQRQTDDYPYGGGCGTRESTSSCHNKKPPCKNFEIIVSVVDTPENIFLILFKNNCLVNFT